MDTTEWLEFKLWRDECFADNKRNPNPPQVVMAYQERAIRDAADKE